MNVPDPVQDSASIIPTMVTMDTSNSSLYSRDYSSFAGDYNMSFTASETLTSVVTTDTSASESVLPMDTSLSSLNRNTVFMSANATSSEVFFMSSSSVTQYLPEYTNTSFTSFTDYTADYSSGSSVVSPTSTTDGFFSTSFIIDITTTTAPTVTLLPIELFLMPRTVFENASIEDIIGTIVSNEGTANILDLSILLINDAEGRFKLYENKILLARHILYAVSPSHQIEINAAYTNYRDISKSFTFTILVIQSDLCQTDRIKCHEKASCSKNENYNFVCTCINGYAGDGEECTNINDCVITNQVGATVPVNPCRNGGVCYDGDLSYTCECPRGFSGKDCEQADETLNPCYEQPCLNNGACVVNSETSVTCVCEEAWEGERCEIQKDRCQNNICQAGGTCIPLGQVLSCGCIIERTGFRCEFYKVSCINVVCPRGQFCVPKFDQLGHYCVEMADHIVYLYFKEADIRKVISHEELQIRLWDFYYNNIQLPTMPARRRRRDTLQGHIERGHTYMYQTGAAETLPGQFGVSFVALTRDGNIYNKGEILQNMVSACENMRR